MRQFMFVLSRVAREQQAKEKALKKVREQEKLEHVARLTATLGIIDNKKVPRRVRMSIVRGICKKDKVVATYLRLQGVKV